jgi:hypothetical protein
VTRRLAAVALLIALLGSACGLLPKATPNPGVPCEQLYGKSECVAIVKLATTLLRMSPDDIVAINIAPNPTLAPGDAHGAAPPIRLRLTLKDGSILEANVCGGVSREPICSVQPRASPG